MIKANVVQTDGRHNEGEFCSAIVMVIEQESMSTAVFSMTGIAGVNPTVHEPKLVRLQYSNDNGIDIEDSHKVLKFFRANAKLEFKQLIKIYHEEEDE